MYIELFTLVLKSCSRKSLAVLAVSFELTSMCSHHLGFLYYATLEAGIELQLARNMTSQTQRIWHECY